MLNGIAISCTHILREDRYHYISVFTESVRNSPVLLKGATYTDFEKEFCSMPLLALAVVLTRDSTQRYIVGCSLEFATI